MAALADDLMQKLHGTNIYAGFVAKFPLDLQGWNSDHPVFHEIIQRDRPRVIIDVGVWKGGSTIGFARLMRANEIDGAVICVDTFLGGLERWNSDPALFALSPRQFGRPLVYEQFLSNVIHTETQDRIVPLPQTSTHAAVILKRSGLLADLIHIDASHDYETVLSDARQYWELLAPGGWLIGDDYGPGWPGVAKAADEFAAELGMPLDVRSPKWILRKQ